MTANELSVVVLTGLSSCALTLVWVGRRAGRQLRELEVERLHTRQLSQEHQKEVAERQRLANVLTEAERSLARRDTELQLALQRCATLEASLHGHTLAQAKLLQLERELATARAQLEAVEAGAFDREAAAQANQALRLELERATQHLVTAQGEAMLTRNQDQLESVLAPMREQLAELTEVARTNAVQDSRERAVLLEQLRNLDEAQRRLHTETLSLSRALSADSKAQGAWGELVLERLFETAGLTEGREYELQVSLPDDAGGARRPDAIVWLPQGRAVIIDAKCPLQAFLASSKANTDTERELDLEAHVTAMHGHVRLLAGKDYATLLRGKALDLVFLFVPNEAAFHAALSADERLYEEAFRQRVVICSPTTLLASLQVVQHVWRSERQTLNAQRIAEAAGKMIDKLSGALEAFDELGDRLGRAQTAYEQARSRLSGGRGSVLQLAARVVDLGAPQNRAARLEGVSAKLGGGLPDAEPEPAPEAEPTADVLR